MVANDWVVADPRDAALAELRAELLNVQQVYALLQEMHKALWKRLGEMLERAERAEQLLAKVPEDVEKVWTCFDKD